MRENLTLGSGAWGKARTSTLPYKRRVPELTHLYRIAYQELDNMINTWEMRFQMEFGCLREIVIETIQSYLNCGILAHGFAKADCPGCDNSIVIAFSCKKRGLCPACAAKRSIIFSEHLHDEILPLVQQRHIVFSLPKRLRLFFKFNRKLNSILFTAASACLREFVEAVIPGALPGSVLVVQTAGDSLNFNPHLHGILASGGFNSSGDFVPIEKFDLEKLTKLFTHKVLQALKASDLLSESSITQILDQKHSGFSVWVGEPVSPSDPDYRLFLARYIDRGPVANSKIIIDGDIVTYQTNKDVDPVTHEFEPVEFLARITPHIPGKWEQTTRYYGFYSHRTRGKRRKLAATALTNETTNPTNPNLVTVLDPVPKKKASKSWAALIKRIFEVDPLTCQKCGETMKINSFVTNQSEINKILRELQIPSFQKPTPIKINSPPGTLIPDPEFQEYLRAYQMH